MVNSNGNSNSERSVDMGIGETTRQCVAEKAAPAQDNQRDDDSRISQPANDYPSIALVPALRAILTSVERTIAHPLLGNNEPLAATLRQLHTLLGKLPRMTDAAFMEAIATLASDKPRRGAAKGNEEGERHLCDLSLDEIERALADPDIAKQQLLAIAKERFGASTGSLSKLNREFLREKVAAFVMNERGHQAIARMASRDPNPRPGRATNPSAGGQANAAHDQEMVEDRK